MITTKAQIVRMYLAPDRNALLSLADHCVRSRNYANVIVAGEQPALNYLSMDEAMVHCTRRSGSGRRFGNCDGGPAAVGEHPFSCAAGVGAQRE